MYPNYANTHADHFVFSSNSDQLHSMILPIDFNDFTNVWGFFLTGHKGSAVAKVSKLFKAENGEHFNVSSTSEWVQGKGSVVYSTWW